MPATNARWKWCGHVLTDKLGIHLLFLSEEHGGLGGGTFDFYRVCEELARIDLGVATAVFATFLGSDPILFGATPEQKKIWLTRIAEEGCSLPTAPPNRTPAAISGSEQHGRARHGRRPDCRLQDQTG